MFTLEKGTHQKNKDLPTTLAQDQSLSPSNDLPTTPGNSNPSLSNSTPTTADLDRKGVRTYTEHPITKYVSYHKLSKSHKAFTSKISHLFIPRTIQEALDNPDWKLDILEKMNALKKNRTWEIVNLPREKKTVGCKWVFTIKCRADGSIERYKARLVAKGFTQTHDIDYQETFAPVSMINSICVLLSLAVSLDWPLHRLDVKKRILKRGFERGSLYEPTTGV